MRVVDLVVWCDCVDLMCWDHGGVIECVVIRGWSVVYGV